VTVDITAEIMTDVLVAIDIISMTYEHIFIFRVGRYGLRRQ
jgi:hypothetical protein